MFLTAASRTSSPGRVGGPGWEAEKLLLESLVEDCLP